MIFYTHLICYECHLCPNDWTNVILKLIIVPMATASISSLHYRSPLVTNGISKKFQIALHLQWCIYTLYITALSVWSTDMQFILFEKSLSIFSYRFPGKFVHGILHVFQWNENFCAYRFIVHSYTM